ncbi:putative HotDog domain-containing protein [Rosa chinensis]|uniref:Putative HotDog domain-containing protein n=1 Tax=Rosa chinensis TaxID=74649 RepID=A0A2P6RHK1_ROSCH|nr:putative HotDog domain-containing protein [Rosa chinensis]
MGSGIELEGWTWSEEGFEFGGGGSQLSPSSLSQSLISPNLFNFKIRCVQVSLCRMFHSPVTQALWEVTSLKFERLLDPLVDAPPQSQLIKKSPSQSRTAIPYNFSTDFILREQYGDPWNEVRIGKLLEDLDALAKTISVKVGKMVQVEWRSRCLILSSFMETQSV